MVGLLYWTRWCCINLTVNLCCHHLCIVFSAQNETTSMMFLLIVNIDLHFESRTLMKSLQGPLYTRVLDYYLVGGRKFDLTFAPPFASLKATQHILDKGLFHFLCNPLFKVFGDFIKSL